MMKLELLDLIKLCGLQRCDCDKKARKVHTTLCLNDVCKRSLFEKKIRTRKQEVTLRKDGEFVGLKNLGATCYVNAYLQVWFFEPLIRRAVYDLILDGDANNGAESCTKIVNFNGGVNTDKLGEAMNTSATKVKEDSKGCNEKSKSVLSAADSEIMKELQFVFASLEKTRKLYVDPSGFVRALRLNAHEMQDADEFYTLFVRHKLEKVLLQHGNDVITRHFVGELVHENRCLSCQQTTQRVSAFSSLDVHVRKVTACHTSKLNTNTSVGDGESEVKPPRTPTTENHRSLSECLQQYFAVERMSGENRYRCERCAAHCEAERRTLLRRTPTVLCVQLLRFVYNPQRGRKQKLAAQIDFDETLDLSPFAASDTTVTDAGGDADYRYQLASIIMHRGAVAHAGHYVSIVRMPDSRWFQFNDERVERVRQSDLFPPPEVLHAPPPSSADAKTKVKVKADPAALLGKAVRRDAYILIYRKITRRGVMASVNSRPPPDCAMRRVAADNEAYVHGASERASLRSAEVARFERNREQLATLFAALPLNLTFLNDSNIQYDETEAESELSRVAFLPKTGFRDWLSSQLNLDAEPDSNVTKTSEMELETEPTATASATLTNGSERTGDDSLVRDGGAISTCSDVADAAKTDGDEHDEEHTSPSSDNHKVDADTEVDMYADPETDNKATDDEYEYVMDEPEQNALPPSQPDALPWQLTDDTMETFRRPHPAPLSFSDFVCKHGCLAPTEIARGALKAIDAEALRQLVATFPISFDTAKLHPTSNRFVGFNEVCRQCAAQLDADARWRCTLQRDAAIVNERTKASAVDCVSHDFVFVGRSTLRCWTKLAERARKPAEVSNEQTSTCTPASASTPTSTAASSASTDPAYFNADICCLPHGKPALTAYDRAVRVPESLFLTVFARYFDFSRWPSLASPQAQSQCEAIADWDADVDSFRKSSFFAHFAYGTTRVCEACMDEQCKSVAEKGRLEFLLSRPRSRFAFDRVALRRRLMELVGRVELPSYSFNLVSVTWLQLLKRHFTTINAGRLSQSQKDKVQTRRLRSVENCELLCEHGSLRYRSLENGEAVFLNADEYATVRAIFPEIDFEIRCDCVLLPTQASSSTIQAADVNHELVVSYSPEACSQCAALFEADECAVDEQAEELDYVDAQLIVRRLATAADRDRYVTEERAKLERANMPAAAEVSTHTNTSSQDVLSRNASSVDVKDYTAGIITQEEISSAKVDVEESDSDATNGTDSPVKASCGIDSDWVSRKAGAGVRKRVGEEDPCASAKRCREDTSLQPPQVAAVPAAFGSVRRSERIHNRELTKFTAVQTVETASGSRGRKKDERLLVKASSSMTIGALKCELARRCGAMASDQHVYWNGDELPSDCTLREFAIPRSATLFLFVDEASVEEDGAMFDDWLAEEAHSPLGRSSGSALSATPRETGFRGTYLLDD